MNQKLQKTWGRERSVVQSPPWAAVIKSWMGEIEVWVPIRLKSILETIYKSLKIPRTNLWNKYGSWLNLPDRGETVEAGEETSVSGNTAAVHWVTYLNITFLIHLDHFDTKCFSFIETVSPALRPSVFMCLCICTTSHHCTQEISKSNKWTTIQSCKKCPNGARPCSQHCSSSH